ncbi:ChuX/HutX family heme-like substrate-binding protein [Pseudomonas vranovensis]|uniref:ChuX/HutX family heme-like substrate-binding protein n=1 Tax=Pseudomonas vranovensis TaxID=321661 RepID=UPI00040C47FF|nr:ChuX/HutX family heme-like substrate-binding protein [Pseudomonas vranovensis]
MTVLTAAEPGVCLDADCLHLDVPAVEVAAHLHALGPVLTRTPASHAWIEQLGRYPQSDDISEAGLVIGDDGLDLRLNLRAWYWVGVSHDAGAGSYALKVFDRHGRLLLCVMSVPESSLAEWRQLYGRCVERRPEFALKEPFVRRELLVPGLVEEWAAMNNVHEHFALLKRHGLTRYEGNELVTPQFARRLAERSPVALFRQLAGSGLELMLFVYSAGSVQIFTGQLSGMHAYENRLVFEMPATSLAAATCFSIVDAMEAQTWRVHKPNERGGVTSLELFDAGQRLIVQVFARRPAGEPEQVAWRQWLDALEVMQ